MPMRLLPSTTILELLLVAAAVAAANSVADVAAATSVAYITLHCLAS